MQKCEKNEYFMDLFEYLNIERYFILGENNPFIMTKR